MPHSRKLSIKERKQRQRAATAKFRLKNAKGITKKGNTDDELSAKENETYQKLTKMDKVAQINFCVNFYLEYFEKILDQETDKKGREILFNFISRYFAK